MTTASFASLSLPGLTAVPPPAAAAAPKAAGGGGSFSQLLQQASRRPPEAQPRAQAPAAPAAPSAPSGKTAAASGPMSEAAQGVAREAQQGDARDAEEDMALPPPAELPPGLLPGWPAEARAEAAAPELAPGAAELPMHGLPSTAEAAPRLATDAALALPRETGAVDANAPRVANRGAERFATLPLQHGAPDEGAEHAASTAQAGAAAAGTPAAAADKAPVELRGLEAAQAATAAGPVLPGLQPLSQAAAPQAGAAAQPAAPVEARIDTPPDSPAFGAALASRVSYLVREGVQQARLQLNPAELGPVNVQITLQGTQAQVDFAAASAATRAALEGSLAQLASALQAGGLTLAGGGVSQHPSQQGEGQAGGERGERAAGQDAAGTPADEQGAPGAVRTVSGGLDLYA